MSTGVLNQEVTTAIKVELTARQLSQNQLAQFLGWSQTYINRRMRNVAPWTLDDIEQVAGQLDVTPTRLVDHPQLRRMRQSA